MKARYIIFALIGTVIMFIIWSMADMTCKPCIIPPNAPDNYVCASSCQLEPRWVDWFRSFTDTF